MTTKQLASVRWLIGITLVAGLIVARSARAEFVHPGITHSQESLDFVRSKIELGEQPWADAWTELQGSRHASLDWQPKPFVDVQRGPYNKPDVGSSEFSRDAKAAYVHALCWVVGANEAHAEKSAEILDAWSGTLKSISNHDARLLVGMEGYLYCNAAELVRHTWDGWPEQQQIQFETMLCDVFYPTIKDFYPSANGNWDAAMLQTMLAMGVYLDDRPMFDRGVDYFLSGKGNGAVGNYFMPSGQCQESGRDQAHTQMGLNFLASTCEIAWNQGLDLYAAYDNRLLKGFEYTAKYNLGFDVPYQPYRSFEGRYHYKSISDDSRGRMQPIYEKVLNHYENRKGLDAEFTRQAVMKLRGRGDAQGSKRRRSSRRGSSALDTLMFAEQGHVAATHGVTVQDASRQSNASRKPKGAKYLETGGRRELEVVYKTVSGRDLKLDLYYPTRERSEECPVVIFTHGGGWAAGNRYKAASGSFAVVFERLIKQGFAVAPVSYRLARKGRNVAMRDCVIDCKDAIRYLAKNSESLQLDPQRIFVMGDSAGGHIAQMLLLTSPKQLPGAADLVDVRYRMAGGVSWYGPCDFEDMDLFNHDDRADFRDRFEQRIMGSSSGLIDKLERYQEISPINYLSQESPPLLMIQGDKDTTIPVKHAYHMKRKAVAIKAPVEIMIIKNSGHNWREVDADIEPSREAIVQRTTEFFVEQLEAGGR